MQKYKEYYFFLTQQCPNRCKYCYIDWHASDMTKEDIDKYIEKYTPSRIIFFGGEPLLRLDLIEYTVKKYYGKCRFQVVTSTCANFKEFLDFHEKYPLDEVQLSWDGWMDSRIDINGNSIAQKVYDNIIYALNKEIRFDIKTVINNVNISQLRDIHDFFKEIRNSGKYKGYGNGEFVIAHGEDYSNEFYECLERDLIYTFDFDKLYIEHLNKLCAWVSQDKSYCSCDIGKYHIVLPSGEVNNCTALSQFGVKLDDTEAQQRCTHPDCMNCKYGAICDGGCRYER